MVEAKMPMLAITGSLKSALAKDLATVPQARPILTGNFNFHPIPPLRRNARGRSTKDAL